MKTLYKNTYVYVKTDEWTFSYGWLLTDGDRIAAVGLGDPESNLNSFGENVKAVDLGGARLAPGLKDAHTQEALHQLLLIWQLLGQWTS